MYIFLNNVNLKTLKEVKQCTAIMSVDMYL